MDEHQAAVKDFHRRCMGYGSTMVLLVVIWALTRGGFHPTGDGGSPDVRIGWGFWPIWFIVIGALDIGRRARRVFVEHDDSQP